MAVKFWDNIAVADTRQSEGAIPLCVDLDGTLVHSDTLAETALLLLKRNPLYIFSMLVWLFSGKANLKEQIAARAEIDVTILPYNQALLEWLREQADTRPLVLVTGANGRIANSIADHLDIFPQVIASSGRHNMSAGTKRDELDRQFGSNGYDYAGNSRDDLKVWAHCRRAVVVNATAAVAGRAAKLVPVEKEFPRLYDSSSELFRALRPHQWSKNLLLFVNILMAHQLSDQNLMLSTVIAFMAFCLCSSGVYLINDMLDIEADRQHAQKNSRPFASGSAPLGAGLVTAAMLLTVAFALAFYAGGEFFLCLTTYFLLTLAYSFYLKRFVILDVIILAILYTLRIIAGASVAGIMPSFWLMSFSLFIFTSLAMAKRYAELKSMEHNSLAWVSGRGYHVSDLPVIANLGVSSGYIATLVLALYIDSPAVVALYQDEGFIWLLCPLLLYWIGRIWLLATRGELHQDPVIFAISDKISYLVLILGLLTLWVAV
jgi:4-hydroxybenzoate polyprenyltransferase